MASTASSRRSGDRGAMSDTSWSEPGPLPPHPGRTEEPPPSGAAAITAGALAIILGLFGALASIFVVSRIAEVDDVGLAGYGATVGFIGVTALLIFGAVFLLLRNEVGRRMVLLGSLLSAVAGFTGLVIFGYALVRLANSDAMLAELSVFISTIMIVVTACVTTLALATLFTSMAPSTKRWCEHGRR